MKAKIFISCGQNERDSRELRIAEEVGKIVKEKGFEPYLAIKHQDSKSFRENIFREISDAEYFLFIDLRRELLNNSQYRGSLFCHQELAIASYLNLESAYFHESETKREGLSKYIQSNSIQFSNEKELYNKLKGHLETKKWNPNWKNKLSLTVAPDTPSVADVTNNRPVKSVWYHIFVYNHHQQKHAKQCFAFLESYVSKSTGKIHYPKTVELHWAGCNLPGVTILPRSSRELDALTEHQEVPKVVYVHSFSTSTQYNPATLSPGEYELTYRIVSDNFPEARAGFYVKYNGMLQGVEEFRILEETE